MGWGKGCEYKVERKAREVGRGERRDGGRREKGRGKEIRTRGKSSRIKYHKPGIDMAGPPPKAENAVNGTPKPCHIVPHSSIELELGSWGLVWGGGCCTLESGGEMWGGGMEGDGNVMGWESIPRILVSVESIGLSKG